MSSINYTERVVCPSLGETLGQIGGSLTFFEYPSKTGFFLLINKAKAK